MKKFKRIIAALTSLVSTENCPPKLPFFDHK